MLTRLSSRWLQMALLSGISIAQHSALAQGTSATPGPGANPVQSEADSDALAEITVTAERRTETLQKTAVAVSVRVGADLQSAGRVSINQILEDVPGVTTSVSYGTAVNTDVQAPNITIRGVSSNSAVPGSTTSVVPAVAEYVDGVVNGLGGDYDIQRVEVLRGPQGTLYGRSATGGVVNVLINDPQLDRYSGTAAIEVGDYALRHYTAALNLPFDDVLALRVSGNYYDREGYYSKDGGQIDTAEGRAKLLFEPNDSLSALFGMALQDNREHSGGNQGVLGLDNVVRYDTTVPLGTGNDESRQYWARIIWDFGPATLTYIPALHTWDQHGTLYGTPSAGATAIEDQRTPYDVFHTEELRLSSAAGARIKWQTGVFYYNNNLHNTFTLDIESAVLPPGGLILQDSATSRLTQNAGVFAETVFPFTDSTRLNTGVRYDYTRVRTGENDCSGVAVAPLSCLIVTPQEGTRDWNNFTYKVRLEHDLTPSNLLYGSISSAFLPGDVSVTNGPPSGALMEATYEPETLTALEIGSKNRFLRDELQVNGDVFYYRYGAQQQAVQIGEVSNVDLYTIADSPARMLGAELDVLWNVTSHDRLGVNASYIDAYYVDKPAVFVSGVVEGREPGVIPITIDPTYRHIFDLPAGQTLTFDAEALYHSPYDVVPLPQEYAEEGLSWSVHNGNELTGNLTLTWSAPKWLNVSAYVRNVSDQRYKAYVSVSPTTTSAGTATLTDPRTFGVVVSTTFGQ